VTAEVLLRKLHETIDKVTRDVDAFRFNTAVAALMELTNLMQDYIQAGGRRDDAWESSCRELTRLIAPFAPHLAEELWQRLGGENLCAFSAWPEADPARLQRATVTVVVQVDGRLRDRLEMPAGVTEDEARVSALRSANVARALEGRSPRRAVFIADRLINLVTR
jgi:leucyl-tRNA synthetase